ncbi:hypothetical protein EDD21DRAFT_314671 [Dissophora ornata]|nr:hypothetical protein EDD21DRAFT_314671 [Dissophora ornata]
MDASDLISYKEQVATIETALQADPLNADLLTLKTELLELISLTESLIQQEAQNQTTISSSSSSSSIPQPIYQPPPPTRHWAVGERCRALYADDGKYYEATILSIGGSGQVYSVQYKGYEASPPALVGPQDLKLPHDNKKYQNGHHQHSAGAVTTGEAGNETEKGQKKRGADGGLAKKKKTAGGGGEQVQKQMAWQNFAKAGAKKTKGNAGPVMKKSIFATPDNPEGKGKVNKNNNAGMDRAQMRRFFFF